MKNLRRKWLVLWKMILGIRRTSPEHWKILKFALWETFLSKVYVWAKTLLRSYVSWHWRVMQYLKKNWLMVRKMTRNLVNFHASSCKRENVQFDGLDFSKGYKFLAGKVQKSSVSWHWRAVDKKAKFWETCIFCVMQ